MTAIRTACNTGLNCSLPETQFNKYKRTKRAFEEHCPVAPEVLIEGY